jgi:predicted nucleotidyltransferase component of viral defense system
MPRAGGRKPTAIMKELLQAIDEYLVAQDIYDRQHTEQTRKMKDRKRGVLNHVLNKYKKAQEQQAAMFAAQEPVLFAATLPENEGA